ncbi:hypothetical protein, partial [Phascolarctobacterium faecium]|uniref:hypothetical protein n=1 Tax=Phascolarctobacterium faecium TaxID=33025 RepID=UPI003AB23DE8
NTYVPPHKTREVLSVHFCFSPRYAWRRQSFVNGLTSWFQRLGKQWKNFSGFCFTTLKGGILLLLFYQTQQKLFLLRPGI